jgi:rhodanese-related sulfurtransferase
VNPRGGRDDRGFVSDDSAADHVTVHDLVTARAEGAVVIDVREPLEFAGGRVPGAVNVPLSTVPLALGRLAELGVGGPLYVICHLGSRSAQAADYLRQYGIEAHTVDGGTQQWTDQGHPLERDERG